MLLCVQMSLKPDMPDALHDLTSEVDVLHPGEQCKFGSWAGIL